MTTVLFYSLSLDPSAWRDALAARVPGLDFRVHPEIGRGEEVEVLLAWKPPAGTFARLPNLKLIYCTGAGVDQLFADPELPAGVPILRIVDHRQADDMCGYVLGAVLHHHRELDFYAEMQRQGRWEKRPHRYITSSRVGVMGLGALGGAAARRIAACGFATAGWSRSRREIEGVDCFAGAAELDAFLARTDILVCLLPLTPDTTDILNAGLFARLPAGASVINVGRGPHLVDQDLIDALDSGHLAGATLDVFRREPLPADHPFWRHPRVRVTPHLASLADADSVVEQIADNLRRLQDGRPLLNQVDRAAGY